MGNGASPATPDHAGAKGQKSRRAPIAPKLAAAIKRYDSGGMAGRSAA
jgi:hypothetical protein